MDGTYTTAARGGPPARRWHPSLRLPHVRRESGGSVLLVCWSLTRLVLVIGMVLGHQYCDPQFYRYAGDFAVGRWPYHDVAVEYPPLAMVLLLVPALPLLPFAAIAPRPLPMLPPGLTQLVVPLTPRYAAYGVSFGVEMLLLDLLTLWLVRKVAARLLPGDPLGIRAGLLYVLLIFASGALLQKFDLAVGTLCLAAIYLLICRRHALAWSVLALAALVKGYPVLAVPVFALYMLHQAPPGSQVARVRACWRDLLTGALAFATVIAAATFPVVLVAGLSGVLHTLTYHTGRGIEIESIYASIVLTLGSLPGLGAHTAFSEGDLSRIVLSPISSALGATANYVTVALLALAYGAVAWATLRGGRGEGAPASGTSAASSIAGDATHHGEQSAAWLLVAGVCAVVLAFDLGFRALPAHYLLALIPLAAVLRLPRGRAARLWLGALLAIALLGQGVTLVWPALRDLLPWAVGLLDLRNLAWLASYLVLLGALWRFGLMTAHGSAPGERDQATDAALVRAPTDVAPPATGETKPLPRRRRFMRAWARRMTTPPPVPGFTPRREDFFAYLFSRVAPLHLALAAGLASTVIYAGFALSFPITLWWSHPHDGSSTRLINDIGRITDYSPFAAAAFVGAVLALFACQFVALVAAGHIAQRGPASPTERLTRRLLWLFPVAFVVVMIWMQPITTTDLYGYVARGYLYAHLHLNPMVTPATQLPGGQLVDRPAAPYGPLWLLVAAAVARLAGENLLANMLAFKVIAALAVILTSICVDRLADTLYPDRRLRIDVLFSWSPLLIFEAIGNGHNDIVMMLCVVAAFAAMLRGRARIAFGLLVLGALVKYVSAFFVPLWLVYELRRRTRSVEVPATLVAVPAIPLAGAEQHPARALVRARVVAAREVLDRIDQRAAFWLLLHVTLIGGILTAAFYAPFWYGIKTFTGLGQQLRPGYYNTSLVGFLSAPLQILVQPHQFDALDKTVRLVFYVLFGIYAFIQTRRLWIGERQADVRQVITAAAKIIFAALILITFWFQPWYIVWLIPLAALSDEPFVRRQGPIFALGALMTYAVSNFLLVGETGLAHDLFEQFFTILVAFVPLLLLRASPYEQGWAEVVRRYAGSIGRSLLVSPIFAERLALFLVLIVAALLRLLHLGSLVQSLPTSGAAAGTLKEVSADLRLYVSDPQGLHGPFGAVQGVLVFIFGPTPAAALLPSAIIGTLTVFVIYLLAQEILRQGWGRGNTAVALVAALLAATSRWHLSLSRSGMEVVLLPLLMCLAVYWLLLAFRLGAPPVPVAQARRISHRRAAHTRHKRQRRQTQAATQPQPEHAMLAAEGSTMRRTLLLYAGCGVCTGLACDLAPGLWLLPLLVIGFLLVWRWRVPEWFTTVRPRLAVLSGMALLTGLPTLGYFLSRVVGFPAGSPVLARTSVATAPGPGPLSMSFWGQVAHNAGQVLGLFARQDYSAGYPASGGSTIIPLLLSPIFFLGLAILLVRWRNLTALALLLLVALPLVASVAVGTPTSVIEAAATLPAMCIVPALALYEVGQFLGHLPIVLDRINGARIFTTPEQIGRVILLVFLLVTTIRTFFWYFEATLPNTAPHSDNSPSWIGPSVASARFADSLYPAGVLVAGRHAQGDLWPGGLPLAGNAGIVQLTYGGGERRQVGA